MIADEIKIEYIGGPTAILEVAGYRFLTDPTFDPKGSSYATNLYTLHKLQDPLADIRNIGHIDFVLLTHDHHFDNLDNLGRQFLPTVRQVFTTRAAAERLKGNAVGLKNWETHELPTRDGRVILLTGTPCRHGPEGGDRGPVTGFVLSFKDDPTKAVYITGDTVWYEGVEKVARRFDVRVMLLFMGAATVKEVGPDHLTMTVGESIIAARRFDQALIIPMHFEGWGHFTQGREEVEKKYKAAGLSHRLSWPMLNKP